MSNGLQIPPEIPDELVQALDKLLNHGNQYAMVRGGIIASVGLPFWHVIYIGQARIH